MALAKIIGLSTEELSNGHIRIKIDYNGVPTPEEIVNNGKPPRGIVFRELVKRGYLSKTGEVLKPVGVNGYMKKADDGKSACVLYETREPNPISEVISDLASKIASQITTLPFEPDPSKMPSVFRIKPNASYQDPMSN